MRRASKLHEMLPRQGIATSGSGPCPWWPACPCCTRCFPVRGLRLHTRVHSHTPCTLSCTRCFPVRGLRLVMAPTSQYPLLSRKVARDASPSGDCDYLWPARPPPPGPWKGCTRCFPVRGLRPEFPCPLSSHHNHVARDASPSGDCDHVVCRPSDGGHHPSLHEMLPRQGIATPWLARTGPTSLTLLHEMLPRQGIATPGNAPHGGKAKLPCCTRCFPVRGLRRGCAATPCGWSGCTRCFPVRGLRLVCGPPARLRRVI